MICMLDKIYNGNTNTYKTVSYYLPVYKGVNNNRKSKKAQYS